CRAWRRSCQPLLDLLDRIGGDHHRVGADQRHRVQALDVTDLDVGQVAGRQVQVFGRVLGHQQRAAPAAELLQARDHDGGLGRVGVQALDHGQAALAVELGQDRRDRGAVHLAVDLLLEAARLGREGHATAGEDRRGQRAVAGATALLLLGLLGGAGNFRAGLLRLGAGTAGIAVGDHDLVYQVLVELAPEDLLGDRHGLAAVVDGQFHRHAPLLVGRTITSPPGAPGTAPRTAIRPRSASTFTISRPWVLWRTAPMWPAIFLPGNTRPGVWRWPSEPGARCDSELPRVASPMVKFQRLIVPWKPLPLVTPWTSAFWPTSKMSARISPPSSKSPTLPSSTRNSHRPRPASTLALARCPACGLLSSEARRTPAVTWTAE